jgi:predicted SnoaL-like aldol condensation-catalyzing enzyme
LFCNDCGGFSQLVNERQQNSAGAHSADTNADNTELVQRALQVVFSQHHIDEIDQFFSPEFVQHSPYASPGGRDQLRQWWSGIVDSIPDVTTTVEQTLSDGDRVAVFRSVQGTIKKDLDVFGIKGKGQKVIFRVADIFALQEGKIIAHWEVADTGPLMQLSLSSARVL